MVPRCTTNATNCVAASSTPSSLTLNGPKGYAHARIEADIQHRHSGDGSASSPNSASTFLRIVEDRPYFPLLQLDPTKNESVVDVARTVLSAYNKNSRSNNSTDAGDVNSCEGKVTVITGGLTNALFKVDLNSSTDEATNNNTSVLVRVFGSEGMIDRDIDTANFARLCNKSTTGGHNVTNQFTVIHSQLDLLGRFANGRIETWIPNMRQAHHVNDFGATAANCTELSREVARQLARLHYGFDIPEYLVSKKGGGVEMTPTLWRVIEDWTGELKNALEDETFVNDAALVKLFEEVVVSKNNASGTSPAPTTEAIVSELTNELKWLQKVVETKHPDATVVFAHNDVNAANILLDASTTNTDNNDSNSPYNEQTVCLIDFEYGAINYAMFDVANFYCEHCGGNDNAAPDYTLFPEHERQIDFLREYLKAKRGILRAKGEDEEQTAATDAEMIARLLSQVQLFRMASNLYWGVWGVLQAAGDVIDGTFNKENAKLRLLGNVGMNNWDNLRYGMNRLGGYWECKERLLTIGEV
ncbi:predicted protein [Thalassiosira pseudonana CCMP1335]|uniref:ethanolamine kinase n=1 Tax=Thalassiosira pseudonana TaxID=35128 RepID=B8CEV3_THAPS|nr:predicted protein [Thalassiosira pseudonana CCMP1335]EED88100.1 predicted protein [Thalassiosira pseudonana CCMP1335]